MVKEGDRVLFHGRKGRILSKSFGQGCWSVNFEFDDGMPVMSGTARALDKDGKPRVWSERIALSSEEFHSLEVV